MIFNLKAWCLQLKSKSLFLLLFCFFLSLIYSYYTIRGVQLSLNPFRFIDLGIHEIGHWITRGMGLGISIVSGTLFQWAFPFVFAYSFLTRNDLFGFSFVGLWLSQNFLHSSWYCRSAIDSPAVIGRIGLNELLHDWVYIFQHFLPIRYIHEIAFGIYLAGCISGLFFTTVCAIGLLIKWRVIDTSWANDENARDFLERST